MAPELQEKLIRIKQILRKKESLEGRIEQCADCIRKQEERLLVINGRISKADPTTPRVNQGMRLGRRFLIIGILVGLLFFKLIYSTGIKASEENMELLWPLIFALPPMIVGAVLMLSTIRTRRVLKQERENETAEYDRYFNRYAQPEINRCNAEIVQIRQEIKQLLWDSEQDLSILPEKLWNVECISYIIENLENGRAETFAGALALCEMYKKTLEQEATIQKLSEQQAGPWYD